MDNFTGLCEYMDTVPCPTSPTCAPFQFHLVIDLPIAVLTPPGTGTNEPIKCSLGPCSPRKATVDRIWYNAKVAISEESPMGFEVGLLANAGRGFSFPTCLVY